MPPSVTPTADANLVLRLFLELAALAAFGWWGADTGSDTGTGVALAVAAPLTGAAVWGLFVSPRARIVVPRAARFALQLLVFGGGSAALVAIGHPALGIGLAAAAAVNGALILALAGRATLMPVQ